MSSPSRRRGSAASQQRNGSKKFSSGEYADEEDEDSNDFGRPSFNHDNVSVIATAVIADEDSYGYQDEVPQKQLNRSGSNSRRPSQKDIQPYTKHKYISFSSRPVAANIKEWPRALRDEIVKSFDRAHNRETGWKFLKESGWPEGLAETVFKSCSKIAIRFFIVDDSGQFCYSIYHTKLQSITFCSLNETGSMILNDGRRVIKHGTTSK